MDRVDDVCLLMLLPGFGSHRSNKESLKELYLDSSVVQSEHKFPAALLLYLFPEVTVEKALF